MAYEEIDLYDPIGKEGCACFTKEERESFGKMLSKGFVDTFRYLNPGVPDKYSFWTFRGPNMRGINLGWRLDYMIISKEDLPLVVDSTIHPEFHGSDHCPIQLKIDLNRIS